MISFDELERIVEKAVVAGLKACRGIYLEGLRPTTDRKAVGTRPETGTAHIHGTGHK
jgi:hypothetical protein